MTDLTTTLPSSETTIHQGLDFRIARASWGSSPRGEYDVILQGHHLGWVSHNDDPHGAPFLIDGNVNSGNPRRGRQGYFASEADSLESACQSLLIARL